MYLIPVDLFAILTLIIPSKTGRKKKQRPGTHEEPLFSPKRPLLAVSMDHLVSQPLIEVHDGVNDFVWQLLVLT
jgi:hypothetical protein